MGDKNYLPLFTDAWVHPPVFSGSVLLICLVFRVVVFLVLFVFAKCLVYYPMLPVSLDCPFLIAPSVLSNVYLNDDLIIIQLVSIDRTFIYELLTTCISFKT